MSFSLFSSRSYHLKTLLFRRLFIILPLCAFFLFGSASFAHAATYYVDKDSVGGTCNDTSNNGTALTTPFCTFTKAHAVVAAGDTVYFRTGTYPSMLITKSGTSGNYLTFARYASESVIVNAAGAAYGIRTTNTRYVEINGFEVTGATGDTSGGIYLKGQPNTGTDYSLTLSSHNRIINNVVHDNFSGTNYTNGIYLNDTSYNVVQGNTIYNNYFSGITADGTPNVTSVGNQYIGNTVYNNTGAGGDSDGINTNGNRSTGHLIQGNIIYANGDDGIDTWTSSGNIIEKNIVYNHNGTGDGNGFKLGGSTTGGNNIVRYNIAYNNAASGFDMNGNGGNVLYNNVAYDNGIYGFDDGWRESGSTGCLPETSRCYTTLKNNIGLNNTLANINANDMTKTSDYNLWYTSGQAKVSYDYVVYNTIAEYRTASGMSLDVNSISADPLFVSTVTPDFKLQSSSPAINAGTDVGLTADFVGSTVPQGSAPDIGAYEYSAPTTASSLAQYKSDGTTAIVTGNWTDQTTAVFKFSMTSANSSDTLTPQIELRAVGVTFTNSVTNSGSSAAYSGSPVTGTVTVTGLSSGTQYHWQARVSNSTGQSAWVSYGGNAESASDFGVDTAAPTGGSVSINSGATYTTSQSTTLTIGATDSASGLSQMMISENSDFTGASYETYATSKVFSLSSGDGLKTVYIRFKDAAGNVSTSTSDTITLDSAGPTSPSVSINSGATYATSTSATLTLSATDSGSGVLEVIMSENSDFSGASYVSYATSKSFTLSSTNGVRTVYVRFRDAAGNTSTSASDTIILDNAGPTSPSISINSGATYTNSQSVTLTLSATDATTSVTEMILSENSDFSGASYETYATSKAFSLTSSNGTKTVYARFRDAAGNVSTSASDTITLDTAGPTSPSISINSGATYSNSQSVTLTLSATDAVSGVTEMIISENSDFSGASYESYATSKAFSLTSSNGTKTVYAKFRDAQLNESTVASDSIVLDTAGPTSPSVSINSGATATSSQSVTLTISATDAVSGVTEMIISENSDFSGASYESYATSKAFSLSSGDGTKTVYVRFRDATGNVSSSASDTIALDTAGPTSGSISINSGATYTNSQSVTLTISATDAGSGVAQMIISENSDFSGASYETYATTKLFSLTSSNGVKTVYIKFRDGANAESSSTSDTIILDSAGPTSPTISINSGATYSTSTSVTLTLSATDAGSGVTHMILSENSDFSGASYETYATSKAFSLTSSNGTKTVYAKFRDAQLNESTVASDTIILDSAGPTSPSISINSGATSSASQSVTLTLSATDASSGVTEMVISENSDFSGASYESYATSKAFSLSSGDGTKTVYVRFRDAAGNTSTSASDTISLDSAGPTGGSISINSGATYTNSQSVTLTISATDAGSGVSQMIISENSDFSSASYETYATTKLFSLSSSNGVKTVYIKFKDGSDLESASTSDTIILDTAGPTSGSISINSGATYATTTSATLTLSATDSGSGVTQMILSENSDFSGASYETYATSKSFTLTSSNGTKTVYAKFRDAQLNESSVVSDTIILDSAGPTSPSISINSGASSTSSQSVTLTISATDAGSGVTEMIISENSDFSGASYESYATSKAFSLSSGDGVKTVYIRFRDAAGNVSSSASDTITLDAAGPVGGSVSINAGAAYTTSGSVTLTISATDAGSGVAQMIISENSDFTGASYESYATTKLFSLSSSDGIKTVYIKFKDGANTESGVASDTITLDTVGPSSGSISINGGAAYTNTQNVTLTLSATDSGSGVSQMIISENSDFTGASFESYATSKSFALSSNDGLKTVYIKYKDTAGNESSAVSDTITVDTVAPTTPGIPSTTSPTTDSTPTWTWTASTDASSGLASPAYTVEWSESSSFASVVSSSTASTNSFTHTLDLGNGTWYFRVQATDAAGTDSPVSTVGTVVVDTGAPGISSVSTSVGETSATITWTTDEGASSQVEYGVSNSYGSTTTETDTSPRVTSHQVILSGLVTCTTYHYRVKGSDASSNQVIGNDTTFTTAGCVGNATVTAQSAATISNSSGGTVDLISSNVGIGLTVPTAFAATNAVFQIKQLDPAPVTSAISAPAGYTLIGSYIYDLEALSDNFTKITTFLQPITVQVTYQESDVVDRVESSLRIYRYDGSNWIELDDCAVDATAKTVTCTTLNFSIFGLFGQLTPGATPVPSPTPASVTTNFSTSNTHNFTYPPLPGCTDLKPEKTPQFFQINASKTTAELFFSPSGNNTSGYVIIYGYSATDERFSASFQYGATDTAISYEIKDLEPDTTYYFKVRGQHGCMPGDYSNVLKATTRTKRQSLKVKVFTAWEQARDVVLSWTR